MLPELRDAAKFEVNPVDLPDPLCFCGIYDHLAIPEIVTNGENTTHPHSLTLRSRDLVPYAFSGHLTFELSEGEKNVQCQPAHGGRGVELLGDRDEAHALFVELLNDLCKVGQGPGEPVYLIYDNRIDCLGSYVLHESLKGGPSQVPPGESAIVVGIPNQLPPFMPLAEDIYLNLARRMQLNGINQLWVADITYIRLLAEFVYLAVILDGYSRKVVGWKLDRTLASRLAVDALQQAIDQRRPLPGLVHHSDRGIQYASADYVALLKQCGMIPSMSRPANPYDNASCESFIKTLKREEIYANEYRDTPEEFEAQRHGKSEAELHSATLRFFTRDPQKVTTALVGEGTQTPSLPHTPTLLEGSTR
jgi:Integrase core domain